MFIGRGSKTINTLDVWKAVVLKILSPLHQMYRYRSLRHLPNIRLIMLFPIKDFVIIPAEKCFCTICKDTLQKHRSSLTHPHPPLAPTCLRFAPAWSNVPSNLRVRGDGLLFEAARRGLEKLALVDQILEVDEAMKVLSHGDVHGLSSHKRKGRAAQHEHDSFSSSFTEKANTSRRRSGRRK